MNAFIMDKNCLYHKEGKKHQALKGIKTYAIDKFHANEDPKKGHCINCPCNPYSHKKIMKRIKNVNTSAAEQVFSWFRGYAGLLNHTTRSRHYFYVLRYCRIHNGMMDQDDKSHLPQIIKKTFLKKKPTKGCHYMKKMRARK